MDVAEVVFRLGVGVGALLIGVAMVVAVLSLRPLARDVRSLTRDVRRLAELAEGEIPELLTQARNVAANAEVLTEDLAVRLEQSRIAADLPPVGHPPGMPVQSGDAGEDQQIA
jgi:hypothetical protein